MILKIDSEDFFKPYGGKAEDKFKECLDVLIASTNYDLGIILRDLRKFKDARDRFESALKVYESKHFYNALKCKSFIKRIGILEGKDENFEDLFNEMERNKFRLDPETISLICAEYILSLVFSHPNQIDETLRSCEDRMSYKHRVLTEGVLSVFGFFDRRKAIKDLKEYDDEIKKGLNEVVERRVDFVENFGDLVMTELEGKGDFFLKDKAKYFGGLDNLKELVELAKKDRSKVFERVDLITTADSIHAFVRLLWLYLEGFKREAKILAQAESEYWKDRNPCLSWLFGEAAKEDKFKRAVIKLFYYHI